MKSNLPFKLLYVLFFVINVHAQNPGNVSSGLQIWLKADSGVTLSGTDVDSWTDQSPNNITGTSDGTTDAQYTADGLNFNPVITFNGNNFYNYGTPLALNIDPSLQTLSVIVVTTSGEITGGTVISKGDNTNRNFQLWYDDVDRVANYTLGKSIVDGGQKSGTFHVKNEPKINTGIVSVDVDPLLRLTSYVNGVVDGIDINDGTGSGTSSTSDVLVGARRNTGNTGSDEEYHGDIAEIIVYDRFLTLVERQKIESYLAIKYGITLGANDELWDSALGTSSPITYLGTSNNYYNSLGTVVWDGTTNAGFGYNVMGLGRDDLSGLLQTKSATTSQVTTDILTLEGEAGSLSTDNGFLLVGNNGLPATLTSTGTPGRTVSMLNRLWKVSETLADTGNMQLDFDLSSTAISDAVAANLDLYVADNTGLNNFKNYQGSYNSSTKILTFNLIDLEDGQFFTIAEPNVLSGAFSLLFDGVDDIVETNLDLSGLPEVTIMCWVKRTNDTELLQTGIIGQPGVIGLSVLGDDLSVDFAGNLVGGLNLTQSGIGNTSQSWHHIATTFKNGNVKMYFDGELVDSLIDVSGNTLLGVTTAASFNIGGDVTSILSGDNFEGEIDEVRVFSVALEDEQIQQMVYQEIVNGSGKVSGSVIPKDITDTVTDATVDWSSLSLYYTLNAIRGNRIIDGSNGLSNGYAFNLASSSILAQGAPMPYTTVSDGLWTDVSTWENGSVWDITDLPNKDWAIVHVKNDISTSASHNHLGLIVDANKTLTINGTNELNNSLYLELNGTIDLMEDSQLIQSDKSELAVTSAGKILRRQQGHASMYRYNYWSSPVGQQSSISNNTDFNLSMLEDSAGSVQFVGSYNVPLTSPVTVSTYWLYSYVNGLSYNDWQALAPSTNIPAGTGYTQKGPGSAGLDYEYIFSGKPNNGDVLISVTDVGGLGSVPGVSKTEYLLGNPYPSAIDAHQFIDDNVAVTNGVIYLWEQWSGNSHALDEYEGGYAILNKAAKVRAYQFEGVLGNDTGVQSGTKTPTRYLPVGQGFMTEIIADGTVEFNNGQRIFKQEDLNESVFFRSANQVNNTASTDAEEDTIQLIKLKLTISNGVSRELALAFSDVTTDGYDYGYDAKIDNANTNDLTTVLNGEHYVIQSYSSITPEKEVSLVLNSDGVETFTLEMVETENISDDINIYLYDVHNNIYIDLKNSDYEFLSDVAGEINDRFKIVFSQEESLSVDDFEGENVKIFVANGTNVLYAKGLQEDVSELSVTNIVGQKVQSYNEVSVSKIEKGLKLQECSTGVYIIDLKLKSGVSLSEKIVMR
ncbi:LamG domain-containing protein [Winogradskyella marincola]|uniref:LamG domain-containing protein n=1 Tax=Winogradskyella marincola TaxID=3037795 RepID=A0ABT6FYE7_9FLAO|nr:LamG domain-containing protein [Winogradskyella sp. YYF002]MDG4714644.1 LamG domain-containing protein [Winogradskyella sp. YYF002]